MTRSCLAVACRSQVACRWRMASEPASLPASSQTALPKRPIAVERLKPTVTQAAGMEASCRPGRGAPHRPAPGLPAGGSAAAGLILLELWFWAEQTVRRLAASSGSDVIPCRSNHRRLAATSQGRIRVRQTARPACFHLPSIQQFAWSPGAFSPTFIRVLDLPVGDTTVLELLPEKPGRTPHCGQKHVRGELEVWSETRRQENEPRSKGKEYCRTCSRSGFA